MPLSNISLGLKVSSALFLVFTVLPALMALTAILAPKYTAIVCFHNRPHALRVRGRHRHADDADGAHGFDGQRRLRHLPPVGRKGRQDGGGMMTAYLLLLQMTTTSTTVMMNILYH